MIEEIIEKYTKTSAGIESLAKEYKVGKLKIKKILTDNNIPFKKKGAQKIYNEVDFSINIENKLASCKICNKNFNDVENRSGALTNHIKECNPEITIPNKLFRANYKKVNGTFWHFQYFNLIDKPFVETLKCTCNNFETPDIDNKTGALTKHVLNEHGSIEDFIFLYPEYKKYFKGAFEKIENREKEFQDIDAYIECKICGEKLKTINRTHLKMHNLTADEYKKLYGEDSTVSVNTRKKLYDVFSTREIRDTYRSKAEIEIEDFLKQNNLTFDICNKKILNGIELDFYFPEHNLAIEYNGLYWHSEKQGKDQSYHINKTKKCLERGIKLIHIFSDQWESKKDIIKNRLLNQLKLNKEKFFARKCEIVFLGKKEKTEFLNNNHLQGDYSSKVELGLKYNNNIVAVMTFGPMRKFMGGKNEAGVFELYRFASKNVIGGFEKLLKFFIKNYSPAKIITYADRNWSPSNEMCFYSKMGFNFISETSPNYFYTKKYLIREHRFNFTKNKLIKMGFDKNKTEKQIMLERGYDIIWDTGNLKFEMIF